MRRGRNSIFGTAYRYRDVQWKELNAKYLCLHLPRESQLYYVLQPKSLCLRLVELKPRGRAGIIVCYFACSIRVVVPNFLRLESCFSINIYISRVNSVALLRPPQKTKQHNVNPYSRQEQKTVCLRLRPPRPVSPISPHFHLQRHHIPHIHILSSPQKVSRPRWRRSVR